MAQQGLAAAVGEGHVLEAELALHLAQRQGANAAGDGDRGGQQVEHPVGGGHRPLVVVEGAAQGGERPEQPLGDEHQEGVAAGGDRAAPGLQAADHQDGDEGEQDRVADQRHERRREADGAAVGLTVRLALLGQPPQLPGLGGVALDREHAAEIVAQLAGQIAGQLAHGRVAGRQALLEAQRAPEDQRDRNERHPRHRGGEHHHCPAHRQHGGEQLQDLVGAVVEEALQLVDVVVEHGHQPAAAARLKKAHLQFLEVVVGLQAQLVLHRLGQVAPEQPIEVLEQRLGAPDQERDHRQHGELGRHGGHAEAGQPGGVLLHHHVHSQTDQHRRCQVEQLVEHRAAGRQPHLAPVGAQGAEQPPQGGAALGRRTDGRGNHRRGTGGPGNCGCWNQWQALPQLGAAMTRPPGPGSRGSGRGPGRASVCRADHQRLPPPPPPPPPP